MTWLLGPLLGQIPIASLQLAIGILLLLFGMGWLRKASLRTEGVIPLHDEEAIFAAERARLGTPQHRARRSLQWVAGITALKAVLLEGTHSSSSSSLSALARSGSRWRFSRSSPRRDA